MSKKAFSVNFFNSDALSISVGRKGILMSYEEEFLKSENSLSMSCEDDTSLKPLNDGLSTCSGTNFLRFFDGKFNRLPSLAKLIEKKN